MNKLRWVVIVFVVGALAGCASPKEEIKEVVMPQMTLGSCDIKVDQSVEINNDVKKNRPEVIESIKEDKNDVQSKEQSSEEEQVIFKVSVIDEVQATTMQGKSFHKNDQIQLEDLRSVEAGYYGFDGKEHQGRIIVHKAIAEDVLEIFKELYKEKYPIERLEPIDAFDGDDHASMVANNTSGFNYRVIAGTNRLSRHAYGLAIDVNPLVNPWVTSKGVYPDEGSAYADRSAGAQGMILKGDSCYEAFTSRGFEWGGDWNNSKDYQHFEIQIDSIGQ